MYHTMPKVLDEVTLLAYVNTALADFELQPGAHGIITAVTEDEVRVDVVFTYARGNSPYGREHEDYFWVPLDELDEYFEEFIRIEE